MGGLLLAGQSPLEGWQLVGPWRLVGELEHNLLFQDRQHLAYLDPRGPARTLTRLQKP